MILSWARPLQAGPFNAWIGDTSACFPHGTHLVPDLLRRAKIKELLLAHGSCDGTDDFPVRLRFSQGIDDFADTLDSPLGVHEGSVLLEG